MKAQRVPFGSRLNIVLRAKKMRKKDLAEMISVSGTTVSKYLYEKHIRVFRHWYLSQRR